MTWEEIRKIHPALPKISYGWYRHKNGCGWVHDTAIVPDNVEIPETSVVGHGCTIGIWCKIGDDCEIGAYSTIGDGCAIGICSTIGACCTIGDCSKVGDRCKIGDSCTIGDKCTIGDGAIFNRNPLELHNIKYPTNEYCRGWVRCGCEIQTFDWCRKHGKARARQEHMPNIDLKRLMAFVDYVEATQKAEEKCL